MGGGYVGVRLLGGREAEGAAKHSQGKAGGAGEAQRAAAGCGERQAKAQAQEWAAAAGSAADAGPDSAGGPGAVRPGEVGGEASRAVASGGVGMVVGAAAGSQGGRQQEVGGRAGHGAVGGSGERGGSIATKGAGRGTCRQRVCWFMQAASASCGRRAGAWPSLLAAWRWGEAGVGDVSRAVCLDKRRYARCTCSAEPDIIDITPPRIPCKGIYI